MSGSATPWYLEQDGPDPEWWWAIEHKAHPAFYLRALMPGDFAPGRSPRPRHALTLLGRRAAAPLVCGTCGQEPEAESLEPIERFTGDRGFLDQYRTGAGRWPAGTDEDTCWLCGDPAQLVNHEDVVDGQRVRVCRRCWQHLRRGR